MEQMLSTNVFKELKLIFFLFNLPYVNCWPLAKMVKNIHIKYFIKNIYE